MQRPVLLTRPVPVAARRSLRRKAAGPKEDQPQLAVCVPTFQRPHLLRLLLRDLARQTLQPGLLIVIDGDPESGEVRALLHDISPAVSWRVAYIPSNHANLPYQRYLGWRASVGYRWLVYLDDDLRIAQAGCLNKLVEPFRWSGRNIVGVTARIVFSSKRDSQLPQPPQPLGLLDHLRERFGSGRHTPPGGLTPAGHRKLPLYTNQRYENVDWLHGGVMAFRRVLLTADCFCEDLFALAEAGCGLGEDTILSRRASCKGELLFAFCARVKHGSTGGSKACPISAYPLGYATALSRRLINDNFWGLDPARWPDRLALLKSYAGNILLAWAGALQRPRRTRFSYAFGYALGALRGLWPKPVTSHVEWWLDAERALIHAEELQPLRQRLA